MRNSSVLGRTCCRPCRGRFPRIFSKTSSMNGLRNFRACPTKWSGITTLPMGPRNVLMTTCGVLRRNTSPANAKITIALLSRVSTASSTALAATNLLPQPRPLSGAGLEVHHLGDGALRGHPLRALAPLLAPGRSPDRLAAGFALLLQARGPRCVDLQVGVPRPGGLVLPRGTRLAGLREVLRARALHAVLFPRVARLELSRPSLQAILGPMPRLGVVLGRAHLAGVVCRSEADLRKVRKSSPSNKNGSRRVVTTGVVPVSSEPSAITSMTTHRPLLPVGVEPGDSASEAETLRVLPPLLLSPCLVQAPVV